MKRCYAILAAWIAALLVSFVFRSEILDLLSLDRNPTNYEAFGCCVYAGLGTVLYCIRGLYMSVSAKDDWDDRWLTWYLWRPIAGCILGLAVWVILKAGILAVSDSDSSEHNQYAFYALAFIAGVNVKNTLAMIEGIGKKHWGITPSRAAQGADRKSE